MSTTEHWKGRAALMVAHCAGMVDLIALPVWVGALIARYQLDPQEAGALATIFLTGAVLSSLLLSPFFQRIRARLAASLGFALAVVAFAGVALTDRYATMALLHAIAGIGTACALSVTHGTIGRSARPHRLFAMVGLALGVFAIVFLGVTPKVIESLGGPALFWIFSGLMLLAAVVSALAFPATSAKAGAREQAWPLSAPMVFGALGVGCMALVQAMMFSFLERIGADRGFGSAAVMGVLIALGFVNLFPAPLAALLEHRLPARTVLLSGPIVQAALALLMTQSATFAPYAGAAVFFAAVMIFTHTFAFGVLARLDPSGRVLAATPAMLMAGSALGPLVGGTIVKSSGYGALGIAATVIAVVAVACFSQSRQPADAVPQQTLRTP